MLREWQISYGQSLVILALFSMVVVLIGWIIYSSGSGDLPARIKVLENVILETYAKNQELILASANRIESSARKLEMEMGNLEDRARTIESRATGIETRADALEARAGTIQKLVEDERREAGRDRDTIRSILEERATAIQERAKAIEERAVAIQERATAVEALSKEGRDIRTEGLAMLRRIIEILEGRQATPEAHK